MRASGYARAEHDWYVEPRWVVDALLDVETFDGVCLDPACGSGTIPTALRDRGITCHASDIVARGFDAGVADFLESETIVNHIVSNPPYGIIEPFIEKALTVAVGKVALLARLALLEGTKRQPMLRRTPLARVWVSSRRVSMPPGGSGLPAKGGSVAFAWFVWDRSHVGQPRIDWI